MSKTRSAVISINYNPVITSRGDWFGDDGVAATFVSEISKGCADFLKDLGKLEVDIKTINVNFRKQTEDAKLIKILLHVSFKVVGQEMECDSIVETDSYIKLSDAVASRIAFSVGRKLSSLQDDLTKYALKLKEVVPFFFDPPDKQREE